LSDEIGREGLADSFDISMQRGEEESPVDAANDELDEVTASQDSSFFSSRET
jgi:hypothetical protein